MRLLKVILALAILAVAGLAGYAYFGDMTPAPQQVRVPVTLSEGSAVQGRAVALPATDAAPAAAPAAAASDTVAPAAATDAPAGTGDDALD